MSQHGAYGLAWAEAEIDAGWQGLTALRFEPAPPPGFAARLVVTLALPADGLTAADLSLTGPNGAPLDGTVQPILVNDTTLLVDFATRGPRGLSTARLQSGRADPLHPFFAEASFDFFIDCPGGDCREGAIAPSTCSGATTTNRRRVDDMSRVGTRSYVAAIQKSVVLICGNILC
jgi:hypothetical protein